MATWRTKAVTAAAGLLCLGLAGCGLQSASGTVLDAEPGSIKPAKSLEGVPVTVAAKDFTEQQILGNMLAIAMNVAGADVTNLTNTPGSFGVRQAALDGTVDIAPEYTGTGWINYLGNEKPIKGEKEQYEAVYKADLKNGLTWLPPAPMNNTYAFAIREDKGEELGITKLSQLADLPKDELTFCVESEFASRDDGFEPMLKAYDLSKGDLGDVLTLDTGVVYTATAQGRCNFGEVFTTDGRIPGLKLRVLEDDRQFFPLYNLSFVVSTAFLKEHPAVKDISDLIAPKLTNEVMLDLNARVDVEGEDPAIVARDWMKSEGFVN